MEDIKQSQSKLILAYLMTGETLTPIEALNMFGCFRLGARIYDLKAKGHNIETKTIVSGKKRFAKYSLIK